MKRNRKLLREMRDIEQLCYDEADVVLNDIIQRLPSVQKVKVGEGIWSAKVRYITQVFKSIRTGNPNIGVVCTIYWFQHTQEKVNYLRSVRHASYNPDDNEIKMTLLFTLNETDINSSTYESIAHEMYHKLESMRPRDKKAYDNRMDIYYKSKMVRNRESEKLLRDIGWALYYCDDEEHGAFANGAYYFILKQCKQRGGNPMLWLRTTSFYHNYLNLKKIVETLNGDRQTAMQLFANGRMDAKLRMSFQETIAYIMNGYKEYKATLDNLITKIQQVTGTTDSPYNYD